MTHSKFLQQQGLEAEMDAIYSSEERLKLFKMIASDKTCFVCSKSHLVKNLKSFLRELKSLMQERLDKDHKLSDIDLKLFQMDLDRKSSMIQAVWHLMNDQKVEELKDSKRKAENSVRRRVQKITNKVVGNPYLDGVGGHTRYGIFTESKYAKHFRKEDDSEYLLMLLKAVEKEKVFSFFPDDSVQDIAKAVLKYREEWLRIKERLKAKRKPKIGRPAAPERFMGVSAPDLIKKHFGDINYSRGSLRKGSKHNGKKIKDFKFISLVGHVEISDSSYKSMLNSSLNFTQSRLMHEKLDFSKVVKEEIFVRRMEIDLLDRLTGQERLYVGFSNSSDIQAAAYAENMCVHKEKDYQISGHYDYGDECLPVIVRTDDLPEEVREYRVPTAMQTEGAVLVGKSRKIKDMISIRLNRKYQRTAKESDLLSVYGKTVENYQNTISIMSQNEELSYKVEELSGMVKNLDNKIDVSMQKIMQKINASKGSLFTILAGQTLIGIFGYSVAAWIDKGFDLFFEPDKLLGALHEDGLISDISLLYGENGSLLPFDEWPSEDLANFEIAKKAVRLQATVAYWPNMAFSRIMGAGRK